MPYIGAKEVSEHMREPANIYFYFLFKTMAPDGSAFFGIHRSPNISWGTDGNPVRYIGSGVKLQQKVRQYGFGAMRLEVLSVDPSYDVIKERLSRILTPATLSDPKCLNMPLPEKNARISEAMKDLSKSTDHKTAIALAMVGNQNAVKPAGVEEAQPLQALDGMDEVYWHNPDTAEEILLEKDEPGLTGFVKGRLPKAIHSKFNRNKKKVLSDAERALLVKD